MSTTTIDVRNENCTIQVSQFTNFVKTEVSLQNLGNGKLGVSYYLKLSGFISGTWSDGPREVKENGEIVFHVNPSVKMKISHFQKDGGYVSLNISVEFGAGNIPPTQVFNKTLGGNFKPTTGLEEINELLGSLPSTLS